MKAFEARARIAARLTSRLAIALVFIGMQSASLESEVYAASATVQAPPQDGYSALMNYLQQRQSHSAQAAGATNPSDDHDAFATLERFAQSDDSAVASDPSRVGQAPYDEVHSGLHASWKAGAEAAALPSDALDAALPSGHPDVGARLPAGHPAIGAGSTGVASALPSEENPLEGLMARAPAADSAADPYQVLSNFVANDEKASADSPDLLAAVKPKPAANAAASDATSRPASYIGSEACVRCHREQVGTFNQTLHGDILLKHPRSDNEKHGCESCHGPGSAHAATKEPDQGRPGDIIAFGKDSPRPVTERNAICLTCHERADRTYWNGSAHETQGIACTNCHQLMEKVSVKFQLAKSTEVETCFQCHKDRRAQFERPSHHPLREGDMTCSSCHNPHGSATDSLLREASVNETCYKCHADKRGPYLWEHEPVRDSCLNCHEPHGTVNEYLLKIQRPRLCQSCHMGPGHGNPGNPMTVQAVNRSCQNCHTKVHGSNAPAGSLFQR